MVTEENQKQPGPLSDPATPGWVATLQRSVQRTSSSGGRAPPTFNASSSAPQTPPLQTSQQCLSHTSCAGTIMFIIRTPSTRGAFFG